MRLSHQVVPACGWIYKQDETILHGQTWSELVTNVIAHRASNNIEMGNPEYDIEEQLIKNFPTLAVDQFKTVIHRGH